MERRTLRQKLADAEEVLAGYRRGLETGRDLNGDPIDEAGRAWLDKDIPRAEKEVERLKGILSRYA